MVSIISVNYNNWPILVSSAKKTIDVLEKNGILFEYILVDNCSTNESFERLFAEFGSDSRIRLIKSDVNGGFGSGCNLGYANSSGDILWFLNSDTWCSEITDFEKLSELVLAKGTGIVSHSLSTDTGESMNNGSQRVTFSHYFLSSFKPGKLFRRNGFIRFVLSKLFSGSYYIESYNHSALIEDKKVTEIVSGTSFFCSRVVYDILEGFDTKFFLYEEDTDLCFRSGKAGLKNFIVPWVFAMTPGSATTKMLDSTVLKKIKLDSRLYFIEKHFKGIEQIILKVVSKMTWRLY